MHESPRSERALARVASLLALTVLVSVLATCTHSRPSGPTATSESVTRNVEGLAPLAFEGEPWTHEDLEAAAIEAIALKHDKLVARGAKPFAQPQEAADFFLKQRLGEGMKEYPSQQLHDALLDVRRREQEIQTSDGPAPGGIVGWTDLGPGNIGGRTRALVINPDDPDTMYAAGVAGGVWKTVDGGASWNSTDDLMLNLAVCALEMDPTDPDVIYAGTGEGFFWSDTFVRGLGIFKTVDGGATWTQLSGTVNGVPQGAFDYVNKIKISANDPDRVYAATRTGVWRSLDAGATWSVVLRNPRYLGGAPATNGSTVGCTDLVVRPDLVPDQIYAAFGSFEADGLFRSDDGGDSWLGYGVPPNQGRMTLDIAPSNPDVIYLMMADNGSGGATGQVISVFRSTDGGGFFESRLDLTHKFSPWLLSYSTIALGCVESPVIYTQGWYDNIIKVDPIDPDVVWVGGIDVFRSDDGGRTFGMAGYWYYYQFDPPPPIYMHPDQHLIVFHPDFDGTTNQTMYVTNDGGIFRTQNARSTTSQEECPIDLVDEFNQTEGALPGLRWDRLNNGYGVTQYYHGDAARDGTDLFIGGAQDNGTSRVLAADTPNDWKIIQGGDGGYVAIDPIDSDILYTEYNGFPNIWKSTDRGETFTLSVNGITDTDGQFIAPYAMDPSDSDILWTGGSRPWRTTDGAQSWQLVGPNFNGPNTISAVAISPTDSDVVYLGFDNGYVVRTTNGTAPNPTWEIFVNGLYGGWVSSVAIDPNDSDTAYITYSNFGIPHVLRTTNGGQSWVSIDGIEVTGVPDIPAHWIAVRPCNSSQLYVGTELGVFASDDGGVTWNPSNLGLPNTVVESITFRNDNSLVAFTHGRGAFVAELEPCTAQAGPTGGRGGVR